MILYIIVCNVIDDFEISKKKNLEKSNKFNIN